MSRIYLTISKNNIVKAFNFRGNSSCHSFDEDYNYDVDSLLAWETFGKLEQKYIEMMFRENDAVYCFYKQLHEIALRFKYKDGQIAIEYEDYDGKSSNFAKFITSKFSKEDTLRIKNALLTFCF